MNPLPTLSDCLSAHARTQPRKTALRDSHRQLDYRAWDERATRLALALRRLGLAAGDRVAVLAHNRVEWFELYAALARAGMVAVPVNFRLAGPEVAYIVQHSGARALVVQERLCGVVEPVLDSLPAVSGRCVLLADGPAPAAPGWIGYEDLLASPGSPSHAMAGEGDELPAVPPEALFALMYTSGTTGRPKGAMRSHAGNTLMALATALEFGLTRDDTALLVMPLCHANSLYFGVTFALLGATIVIDDRPHFDPAALLAQLARERITFTSLVPTHYVMMLDLPAEVKAAHDLRAVGKLLVSSAPARRETKLAIMELFPNGRLFELYGSTEAGWVTLLRPAEQLEHLGSVGREWAGSGAIRLLDDEGREVPDGQAGELYSCTPWDFDGYWQDPDKTAQARRGRWCSVGDMARRDAEGYIHLVDRKSNMIISGGENIYPSEVEAVVAAHPDVQDVAVVGLPDPKWGEAVHAVVVPRPGRALDAAVLEAWCRPRIAGYKRPRAYRFVNEAAMPRTATGKIQHRRLREQLLGPGPV